MEFPEAIEALLKGLRWTQKRLGEELRKDRNTIVRWKMGIHETTPEVFEKLAALAAPFDAKLARYFAEQAGIDLFGPAIERHRKLLPPIHEVAARRKSPLPPEIELPLQIGVGGLNILAKRAHGGEGAALEYLRSFADQINVRAGVQLPEGGSHESNPDAAPIAPRPAASRCRSARVQKRIHPKY